jgi:GGDEF domain-containing protein
MVARVGGEEFMVLPAAGTDTRTNNIAERIRVAVAEARLVREDGSILQCTVSIGHARASGGDGR